MRIKLSKNQWEIAGIKAGWIKKAQDYDRDDGDHLTWQDEAAAMSRRQCSYCERYNCDGTCVYGEILENMIYKVKNKDSFDVNVNGGRTIERVLADDLKSLRKMESKKSELREYREKAVANLNPEQQELLQYAEGFIIE